MAATDAKPFPIRNTAYRVTFPLLDADGDLVTGAASLDSEVSKDGGAFADCTNEATEIATASGMYYLDLTSTEMNADTVAIIVKSGSAKTTPIVLYPEEAGDIRVNVTQVNGTNQTAGDIPAMITTVDDFLDTEIAAIKAKTDNLPADPADASDIAASFTSLNTKVDTIDDFLDTEIAAIKAKTDSLTFTAANRVDAQVFGIQANAITAASMDPDASAEIADAVWDEDATGHQTGGTFGQAIGDPGADTTTIYQSVVTDAAGANIAADIATIDDFLDTEIAAIKAKTDNLPADPADASDIAASFVTVNAALTTIDDFLDTEIAAIKAKTDNLPADPADASDIAASFVTVNTKLDTIDDLLDTEVAAIKSDTAAILEDTGTTLPATLAALNDLSAAEVNAEIVDALTVDVIADSTPAAGSRGTIAQTVLMNNRLLTEKEVAGTTVTVNKEDGVTPALTLTLDDAVNPTSITRAT